VFEDVEGGGRIVDFLGAGGGQTISLSHVGGPVALVDFLRGGDDAEAEGEDKDGIEGGERLASGQLR